jgi:flagellar biosynthesis/type III secretory pathway protein FliH
MRTPGRWIAGVTLLLFSLPFAAMAYERDYREKGKEAAYRTGFDEGYRAGLRHGEHDFRSRAGYGYRGRDYYRDDGHFGFGYRYKGDYRKGYRDGYRRGYRDGHERYANPPRRWRRDFGR